MVNQEGIYEPTPGEEHHRLVKKYEDPNAKGAPLSRGQAMAIRRKQKEKIRQMTDSFKESLARKNKKEKEEELLRKVKKMLN